MTTYSVTVWQVVGIEREITIEADSCQHAERGVLAVMETRPIPWLHRNGVAHEVLKTVALCTVDAEKCDDPSDLPGA